MTNYFAKNIKYYRIKQNIDQQVMAEDLGVAQSTLSCWENGIRTPDLDMITKIAKYLNIYDDFISKDLTINNSSSFDELELLFSKNKDILTDDDKAYIRFIIEKRRKEIDKELGNDSDK
jgi:transcriptional regulator with XRE-family HTH domain